MKSGYKIVKVIMMMVLGVLITGKAEAVDLNDIYDVLPEVANCKRGALKETEKQTILNEINRIRAIHGIDPVTYDYAKDDNVQQAALMCTANGALNHQPPESWHCYTADGRDGTENSNLYIQTMGNMNFLPESKQSIVSWMWDNDTPELGHRNAIINPFVKKIAFGRVDGQPIDKTFYATSMALYYRSEYNTNISVDYVAYPYHNYPPNYVKKDWYLSFSALYDKQQWWNNTNVDPTGATIQVIPEGSNTSLAVSDIGISKNWGSLGNAVRWKTAGLQENVKYTVNIKNLKVNGQNKDYTYWFKLTYEGTIDPPPAPLLSTPENGTENIGEEVTLKWIAAIGADNYNLQVADNSGFNNPLVDEEGLTARTYDLGNMKEKTTYYWRVSASNLGGTSEWSSAWTFKTGEFIQPPAAPVLASPGDGAKNLDISTILEWNKVDNADSYKVQVSKLQTFNSFVYNSETTGTTFNTDNLDYQTKYFWRVAGVNKGGQGAWSEVWSFETAPEFTEAPSVPVLVYPENESMNIGEKITLQWQPSDRAGTYNVQVSLTDNFTNDIADESLSSTQYEMTGLNTNTKYYWRVSCKNAVGESNWSEVWYFTTKDNFLSPDAPSLKGPGNNTVGTETTLTLEWNPESKSEKYHLQVSKQKDIVTGDVADVEVTGTSYELTGLDEGTWYYWRVAGVNTAGGEGTFSPIWGFKTKEGKPAAPQQLFPPDKSTNISIEPVFRWKSLGDNYLYEIQVSQTDQFLSFEIDEEYIGDTTYASDRLRTDFEYFWRIRAMNVQSQYSDWSPVFSFRTGYSSVPEEIAFEARDIMNNYPNPTDGVTTIKYNVKKYGKVLIRLFNPQGVTIGVLVDKVLQPGEYSINFDGSRLPSGTYYYRMETPEMVVTNMLEIIK